MKFSLKLKFVDDMGSVPEIIAQDTYTETVVQNALWTINSMRAHDGLKPWTEDDLKKHSKGCWTNLTS